MISKSALGAIPSFSISALNLERPYLAQNVFSDEKNEPHFAGIRELSFRVVLSHICFPNRPQRELRLPQHGFVPVIPPNCSECLAQAGVREPRDDNCSKPV